MLLKYTVGYASYLGALVRATALNGNFSDPHHLNKIDHRPPKSPSLTMYPTSATNESIELPNGTGGTDIQIKCNGASYGFDLDISDCEVAKAYVPASPEQVQWAERHTGWQKEVFGLPYRSMGDKASCYIQPVLIDGATSAKANTNQVRNAAAAIRHYCASEGKLQGGIATNIGGDNNLAVIMGAFETKSAVQCEGKDFHRSKDSCRDVLHDMPATAEIEIFGPPSESSATVLLPQVVESDDTRCWLRIFGTSSAKALDSASWYEVWEATTAIWSVCVRHGRKGSLRGLGDPGDLLLTMTPNPNPNPSSYKKGPMALSHSDHMGRPARLVPE